MRQFEVERAELRSLGVMLMFNLVESSTKAARILPRKLLDKAWRGRVASMQDPFKRKGSRRALKAWMPKIDPKKAEKNIGPELAAIARVLAAFLSDAAPHQKDAQTLQRALSLPVSKLEFQRSNNGLLSWRVQCLPARWAAGTLLHYLTKFTADERLLKVNPIGLCHRPECGCIFLKSYSDDLFCCGKCSDKFNYEKRPPGYFAAKMKKHRLQPSEKRA